MARTGSPSFWVLHRVKEGETLAGIGRRYQYANPGPIIAFNCDHLPGSIRKAGGWRRARSGSSRTLVGTSLQPSMKPVVVRGGGFAPLRSDQINSFAVRLDHAGWQQGRVLTIVDAYPLTAPVDAGRTPFLEIPWTVPSINAYIVYQRTLRADIVRYTHELVNEGTDNLDRLNDVLFTVDCLAAVFVGFKDLGKFALSASTFAGTYDDLVREGAKLFAWRMARGGGIAKKGMSLGSGHAAPTRTLPEKTRLTKGFGFWLDNTVGWLSPSKWTATYGAIVEDDADIAWWGAEAVDAKSRNRIIDGAQERIDELDVHVRAAQAACGRSFYRHHVRDAAA